MVCMSLDESCVFWRPGKAIMVQTSLPYLASEPVKVGLPLPILLIKLKLLPRSKTETIPYPEIYSMA